MFVPSVTFSCPGLLARSSEGNRPDPADVTEEARTWAFSVPGVSPRPCHGGTIAHPPTNHNEREPVTPPEQFEG